MGSGREKIREAERGGRGRRRHAHPLLLATETIFCRERSEREGGREKRKKGRRRGGKLPWRKGERKRIFLLLLLTHAHARVQERRKEGERRVGPRREVLRATEEKSVARQRKERDEKLWKRGREREIPGEKERTIGREERD